jgi:enolase
VATIAQILAREVLDSRGRPTVEVEVRTSDGRAGRAIAPSGASPGRHEAAEVRDRGRPRFGGWSVARAVANVRDAIAPALLGRDPADQADIDATLVGLDGTPDKSALGANAILPASLAAAHAAAESAGVPLYAHLNRLWRARLGPGEPAGLGLPIPLVTMICGGRSAGRPLDFQDFQVIPLGARGFSEALEMAVSLYRCLAEVLRDSGEEYQLVADTGGYGPQLRTESLAADRILEAVLRCELRLGADVALAIDVAAGQFLDRESGRYVLRTTGEELDAPGMIGLFEHWARQYPIASIEDGMAEDDWDGWAALTARLGGRLQLVGDDLFATQAARLEAGIARGAGNAILIKPNQAGTLSEALDVMALARRAGYRAIVSGRSGETEDTTIADLAVATGAGQIKVGSVSRSERLAKYNRLLRIEEELGASAPFAGRGALAP